MFVALFAFGIGEAAVVNNEAVTEDTLQPGGELGSECYLGYEVEHILAGCQLFLDQMDIDIGFSAGGDAMEQDDILTG